MRIIGYITSGWRGGAVAIALAHAIVLLGGCCGRAEVEESKAIAAREPRSTQSSSLPADTAVSRPAMPPSSLQPHTFSQIHMAMPVEITVWSASPEQAQAAAKAAFAEVALIDRLMNDYVLDSEISRLSDAAGKGPVDLSPHMLIVLEQAQRIHALTGGAFDPTAAPVIQLWRQATKTGVLPDPQALAAARELVGMNKLGIDSAAGTADLLVPGMRLDFGGIAKGYACDLATEQLRQHGLRITSVQAGGDMVLGDAPPGTQGWEIDLPGAAPMILKNTAVSISGDTSRFVIIDGVRYSHVVDPRTGTGVTSRQMAIVTGPRGILTDPLATAGCVMQEEAFLAVLRRLEGVEARVFTAPADE